MTSKSKQIIMAAVGAYLVYTGVSLVRETIAGEPENQVLFILAGVFFAVFGLATIIYNIRIIVNATKAEIQAGQSDAAENADADSVEGEEAEKKSAAGKGVVDVHVGADTKESGEKENPEAEPEKTQETAEKSAESEGDKQVTEEAEEKNDTKQAEEDKPSKEEESSEEAQKGEE